MKKGKYLNARAAKRASKKLIALALALVLTIGGVVGGTLAWLTSTTGEVKNTFTPSDINITLTETKGEENGDNNWKFKMVPGNVLDKDPTVGVTANSEACYLFIKVEESDTLGTYIAYAIDSAWNPLSGVDGVYYREVDAADAKAGVTYKVLVAGSYTHEGDTVNWADNQVAVKPEVTKEQMNTLTADSAIQPTLTFTAYAAQKANIADAAAAWATING